MEKNNRKNNREAATGENPPAVLVVEDDKGLNFFIQKTLEREGFKTHNAMSGAQAIEVMGGLTDETLVLLDYFLPDMNAKQVIAALLGSGRNAPIIVMTGHGDEKIAVEIMKMGVRDYVIKEPSVVEKLPKIIRHTLDAITKEKELERVEGELLFRNIILSTQQEASIDGILVVDEHGRIISSNRRFADLWEIPPDVIESKSDERALQMVTNKLMDPGEFLKQSETPL